VYGYINLSRAIYQAMMRRRDGVIVNVIGYAGERHFARYIIGSTANAGLMAFTRTMGSLSPDFGVRVVGVNARPSAGARSSAASTCRSAAWRGRMKSPMSWRSWPPRARPMSAARW
jgi:NAD(P)-dependent dehydrogenase (short-subunit alcohol dehydrogenase family)